MAYPPGYYPPPPPQRRGVSGTTIIIALLVVLILLLVAGLSFAFLSKDDVAEAEVTAEPVSTSANPFMPAVGTDQPNVTPPTPPPANPGAVTPPTQRYSGDTPGLFGGTNNYRQCDANKLITFLENNPSKGREWARVLGINFSEIRSYVGTLTPVILRSDTYVRNHGWDNGRIYSFISVLQSGTAVFVNKYGTPVVKCFCGNPLTPYFPPKRYKPKWKCTCRHGEPYWPHWGKTTIVIIERTTTIIEKITIIDYRTNKPIVRPTGPYTVDEPYVPPGTTPTPSPQVSEPPPASEPPQPSEPPVFSEPPQPSEPPAPQYTGEDAVRILRDRIVTCENRGVRYPWERAVSQDVNYNQAGTAYVWVVSVTDHPANGNNKTFTFLVDVPNNTVEPTNDWAQRASQYCPELNQ